MPSWPVPWVIEETEDGEAPWLILVSTILSLSSLKNTWVADSWIYHSGIEKRMRSWKYTF